jgi:hypothetical protein
MMGATTERRKFPGTATSSRGAAKPVHLGDRGAVAVEFALIFPAVLLMFAGIFGIGVVMIQDMQLTFVVQGAAKAESEKSGTGAPWASSQLPEATFSATPTPPCVTGQWPVTLGVFPTVTLLASACWPS